MAHEILPLQNLTSFYIAKMFWNKVFKLEDINMNSMRSNADRSWEIQLTIFRDEAIRNISTFIKKEGLSACHKNILSESIFLLHEAYHQLLLWKLTYDQDNRIDMFEEGEFYAPTFFNADGKFKDALWAKRLMKNMKYSTALRFTLASIYHFDNECLAFWEELFNLEDISDQEGFNAYGICTDFRKLKNLVLELGIQFDQFIRQRADGEIGARVHLPQFFFILARKGFEHAVYSRWRCMSPDQQIQIMEDNAYFQIINGGMDFPRCNVTFFLYSQLTKEKKEEFFQWSLDHDTSETWLSLLFTSNEGPLYYEVLEFIFRLPIFKYSKLLQSLSQRIKQLKLPLDAELFKMLWNKISPEKFHLCLGIGNFIVENLVRAKSFHNVGVIIQNLSIEQKMQCLLDCRYRLGINILHFFCMEGEFDLLEKYLSFFLNCKESHPLNRKYTHRQMKNIGNDLLQKFRNSSHFKAWFKHNLSETVQTEVKERFCALQTKLCVCSFSENNFKSTESTWRICIYNKHFGVKETPELENSSSSNQKRNFPENIKPSKLKKL